MKNIRFYLEFDSKKEKRNSSIRNNRLPEEANCIAIFTNTESESLIYNGGYEGFGSIFYIYNSPVGFTTIGRNYIIDYCKRCSEQLARKYHPKLFERLEQ